MKSKVNIEAQTMLFAVLQRSKIFRVEKLMH